MDEGIVIPIGFFIFLGAVLIVWILANQKSRADLQTTVRQAVDAGQSLSPELVRSLVDQGKARPVYLRRGILNITIAAAIALFGVVLQFEEHDAYIFSGLALFPLFLGIGYLIVWRLTPDRE